MRRLLSAWFREERLRTSGTRVVALALRYNARRLDNLLAQISGMAYAAVSVGRTMLPRG
jgi:hypothetical protein